MEEPLDAAKATDDVCRIARDLVRFDTTNYGAGRSRGEAECADYVRSLLEEVGLSCKAFESETNRTNIVARWEGRDGGLPALMLHGHLDVVPADSARWSVDPFEGVVKEGMLWGRGAVDMKDMDAMIIASVQALIRNGEQPNRDIVLTFFADEEAGSERGSVWMVDNHPEEFAGVTEAISEVGGYSIDIRGTRAYLIQTGEKGLLWLRLRSQGRAGHASQINSENAITSMAGALVRLGNAEWPVSLTDTTSQLLDRVRQIGALPGDLTAMQVAEATGVGARFITASLQNVSNVTMVNAGYKENVVPETASAVVDVRFLPGQRDLVLERVRELAGEDIDVQVEMDLIALETSFDGAIVEAIMRSLSKLDPDAEILPYLLPAGTDNRALSRLGIRGFGFVPLRLPPDLDFPALFHGVDERVPLDALRFGQEVLTDLIRTY